MEAEIILVELKPVPEPARDRQGFRMPPTDVRLAKILKYARANGFRAKWGRRKGEQQVDTCQNEPRAIDPHPLPMLPPAR